MFRHQRMFRLLPHSLSTEPRSFLVASLLYKKRIRILAVSNSHFVPLSILPMSFPARDVAFTVMFRIFGRFKNNPQLKGLICQIYDDRNEIRLTKIKMDEEAIRRFMETGDIPEDSLSEDSSDEEDSLDKQLLEMDANFKFPTSSSSAAAAAEDSLDTAFSNQELSAMNRTYIIGKHDAVSTYPTSAAAASSSSSTTAAGNSHKIRKVLSEEQIKIIEGRIEALKESKSKYTTKDPAAIEIAREISRLREQLGANKKKMERPAEYLATLSHKAYVYKERKMARESSNPSDLLVPPPRFPSLPPASRRKAHSLLTDEEIETAENRMIEISQKLKNPNLTEIEINALKIESKYYRNLIYRNKVKTDKVG